MSRIFNFGDFIKEGVDSNGLVKYSFSFPVKKKYQLKDDGRWTWDEVCDFLKRNGQDLRNDVAVEMDYINIKDELKEATATDEDIDNYVHTYKPKHSKTGGGVHYGGWDEFKEDYGLDFELNELDSEDYYAMMRDFNEGDLDQYFDDDSSFELHNLRLVDTKNIGMAQGTFETNIELNEDQIKSIKGYIEGQCSDGWGEAFEQRSQDEEMDGLNFDVSMIPWSHSNWSITINKI